MTQQPSKPNTPRLTSSIADLGDMPLATLRTTRDPAILDSLRRVTRSSCKFIMTTGSSAGPNRVEIDRATQEEEGEEAQLKE
jgi:FXSXX-COOH protein